MNDFSRTIFGSGTRLDYQARTSAPVREFDGGEPFQEAAPSSSIGAALVPLANERLRMLVSTAHNASVTEFANEIYRLHSLVRRVALFLNTVQRRGLHETFDITSRQLLAGLDEALQQEPAVSEGKVWRDSLRCAVVSRRHVLKLANTKLIGEQPQPDSGQVANTHLGEPRQRLFTWKLVPQPGRFDPLWSNSRYRGVVIARALDPVEARALATRKFRTSDTCDDHLNSPWDRKSLVSCLLVEEEAYDHLGTASVVYP